MERYARLKAGRTSLKSSVTRQLNSLGNYVNVDTLSNSIFEQKRSSLQSTLSSLRSNLDAISETLLNVPGDEHENALQDLEKNELEYETREDDLANLQQIFDARMAEAESKSKPTEISNTKTKPKFKPRDLRIPKWDGDVVNFNSWKLRITDYFKLTGLDGDQEQLAILLYEEALPATLQLTLQDCVSVHEANGVWERLHEKFPPESVPRAILFKLKETKPMVSNSAREMRRVLEKIKEYSRRAKDANCNGDLNCHALLDLIEQKLTTTLVRNFRRSLHSENEQASVDTLIKFLQTETELEERFANELSLNVASKLKSSTINQVRSNSDDRCTLCNKSRHKFVECKKFMSYSLQQRTDAMRRLHRCFTCLSSMHKDPRDCYYRRRCTSCSRSHHTLLACVSKPEQNKIRVENSQQNSSLNANASSFQLSQPSVRSTNECAPNFRYSPTALVELLDTNGTWHKAIALFDSGSDVTLIKKDIVKKLQLERHPKTFKFGVAGGGYRYEKSAIVSVWIRRFDKRSCRYNINALELEKPAHPSHCLKNELFEDLSYLKAIKKYLPKENSEVDILIGYDYANLMAPMSYLKHPTEPDN